MGHQQPVRPGQPRVAPHPEPVPARALALQARRELPRRRGRQGPHHRRVHRAACSRAALERRPAPGGRGQGERADPGGDPHDGDDHVPEPLPALQEARGHDRHGRHRGRGVPRAPTSSNVTVIPTNKPILRARLRGPRLQDREREVHRASSPRSSSTTRRGSRFSSARRASRRAARSRASSSRRRSRTRS